MITENVEKPVETMPEWARTLNDFGKKHWTKPGKKADYVGGMIGSLVALFIVNMIPNWHLPFITGDWMTVLWVMNLSLGAQIIGNAVLFVYDANWFRELVKGGMDVLGLLSLYVFYTIYPLNFAALVGLEWVDVVIQIAMVISMVFTVISLVFRAIRYFFIVIQ
jgi:hypothetical protein